jgi:hypothetical protein
MEEEKSFTTAHVAEDRIESVESTKPVAESQASGPIVREGLKDIIIIMALRRVCTNVIAIGVSV